MKKLTAGIFAGILTIVTVNAANAEIASGAYVRQQVKTVDDKIGTTTTATNEYATEDTVGANIDALDEAVKANADDITTLTSVVGADADHGLRKDVADLKSNLGDAGSVADQIATALGDDFGDEGEPTTVTGAIAGMTATVTGDDNGVVTALSQTKGKVSATKSLIKNENVATDAAIATSKIAFTNDEKAVLSSTITSDKVAAYDNLVSGDNSVDKKIETALGEGIGGDGEPTDVTAALALKQDKLGTTNVVTDGTGNVVTAVTANDGTVTVTTGNMMPAVPETQKGTDGTLVLTAKVSGDTVTYAWEDIARASSGTEQGE